MLLHIHHKNALQWSKPNILEDGFIFKIFLNFDNIRTPKFFSLIYDFKGILIKQSNPLSIHFDITHHIFFIKFSLVKLDHHEKG